ncbi:site-specific recombinase XerD [Micromonospora sp. Llam0]|uniref:tyrosine-type recombinase/integrase n=1 Tax=Micromonospora sp. Llam0 TaxID=2485143 RepID=UPI000F478F3F|nr:site-specific integrase [Micromonospora sp. Llam0]ROO62909.1 site-specific recombinase XerD [Micromonospora sp. Llam0]
MRGSRVALSVTVKGAASLHLVSGVALLRPEESVFAAMLDGWRDQQVARNLSMLTIAARLRVIRAFADHAGGYPWQWLPQMVDEWSADLRSVRGLRRSTLRGYQEAVRLFCDYLTDPAYDWPAECQQRFGSHPVQVCHEWNTAVHVQEGEADPAKRAFTIAELQALFDYADEQVTRIRGAGRKGWLPAFRDATLLKIAYGYGLRRTETRMLDVADFGTNPYAAEFGEFGVCHVRHGKATKGSPPKRRSVLTVWPWTAEMLDQWTAEVRPLLANDGNPALWPSERADRIGLQQINSRLSTYRDALGLGPGLDFHSLRRSYVTHLIEAGWDPLFVQQQVGHEHSSTTAIYTCVSSDFRTRTLRRALDQTLHHALRPTGEIS